MRLALIGFFALSACADETISGYADPDAIYRLTEIDGAAFKSSATIRFPAKGQVQGDAPCNNYSATLTAPYPWFAMGPIAATERACLHMIGEKEFFDALESMMFSEVQGPVLILTNESGGEMVFRATP